MENQLLLAEYSQEITILMHAIKSREQVSEEQKIINAVCMALNVKPSDLASISKAQEHTEARQIIFNILYRRGYTLAAVGKLFNRDHTTVIHALRRYDNNIDSKDKKFAKKLALVNDKIEELCV